MESVGTSTKVSRSRPRRGKYRGLFSRIRSFRTTYRGVSSTTKSLIRRNKDTKFQTDYGDFLMQSGGKDAYYVTQLFSNGIPSGPGRFQAVGDRVKYKRLSFYLSFHIVAPPGIPVECMLGNFQLVLFRPKYQFPDPPDGVEVMEWLWEQITDDAPLNDYMPSYNSLNPNAITVIHRIRDVWKAMPEELLNDNERSSRSFSVEIPYEIVVANKDAIEINPKSQIWMALVFDSHDERIIVNPTCKIHMRFYTRLSYLN